MATKINVSIPDELQAEAVQFMDEISPSKIYQDALKAKIYEVKKHREMLPGGEKMDSIVERLRREKDVFFEVSKREEGYQEGIKFAEGAEYEVLSAAVLVAKTELRCTYKVTVRTLGKDNTDVLSVGLHNKKLLQYFFDLVDTGKVPIGKQESDMRTGSYNAITLDSKSAIQWFTGWENGVLDFWNKLPDDLKD